MFQNRCCGLAILEFLLLHIFFFLSKDDIIMVPTLIGRYHHHLCYAMKCSLRSVVSSFVTKKLISQDLNMAKYLVLAKQVDVC